MKKFLILSLIIACCTMETKAQSFDEGDDVFNAGMGFGYYNYNYAFNRRFSVPALTANYEKGVFKWLGVGPYVGFASWNYSSNTFDGGYSIFAVGGRASFHYTDLLNEFLELGLDQKIDLYFTVIMGLNFNGYTGDFTAFENNEVRLNYGPVLGFRYYLSDNFGAYMEIGRGSFSYGTLGISLKL